MTPRMPAPINTYWGETPKYKATKLASASKTGRHLIACGFAARNNCQATSASRTTMAGVIPLIKCFIHSCHWKRNSTDDTVSIMTVGGMMAPNNSASTPETPPEEYPMNMASLRASLPGTRLENPTASTNCASVISLPTVSLYKSPMDVGPAVVSKLTLRNIQNKRNQR